MLPSALGAVALAWLAASAVELAALAVSLV